MLSNSGYDENRKYSGGKAGDQTGLEWRLVSWYSYPWNCVIRHPNQSVRTKLAELSIAAANNNKIGYDQNQRNTYWNYLVKAGYNPSKITTACEADCSSGVCANIKAVGHLLGIKSLQNISCTYTGNMRSGLKAAGFEILTASKYLTSDKYLLAGDILLNDVHHVAVNVTNGTMSGAENVGYETDETTSCYCNKEDYETVKTYRNGSTSETVYSDTSKKAKIGSLNPYETCDCLGKVNNMYIVRYKIDGTNHYKVGVVAYSGGVK